MKLRQLEIENYGLFSGARFDFSDTGFQLIHGPNEAGKSTLLQLIREVFFGFPSQNPYVFPNHQGEMAATASIELSDGRKVSFRRRKGNKNVVVGRLEGSGATFGESELGTMLGQANARLYEHVFGFSLAELAAGEKSLEDANLSEALYGGGMGGLANFQQVQAALQKEHELLFKPRGSSLTINKLLKSIKDADTALGKSMVKPRDYKELCRQRDAADAAMTELRAKRDALQLHFSSTERLHKALPLWLRLTEDENKSAALHVPDGILHNYDAKKDYRQTVAAIDAISGELAEEHESMAAARTRLTGLQLEPRLIEDAAAAMVKSLERGLEQIERFREDLPKRTQEAAAIRYALGETAARLNPDWDIAFLEKFTVTSSQSEAIGSIALETRDLARDKKNLETQIKEKTRKLDAETRRLDNLKAAPIAPVLAQLTENASQYKTDLQNLSEINTSIAEAALKIDDLQRRLANTVDVEADRLHVLPVPLEAKIKEFVARFGENHDKLSKAKDKLEATQTELSDYRHRLASDDARQKVPDRKILDETRRQRDDAWELIRRTFLESQSTDDALKAELAEKFTQALAEADRLADQRQDKAELVAAHERLAADAERSESKLRELTKIHKTHEAETETLKTQWRELWTQCRLEPDTPEVMRQWLELHGKYFDDLRGQQGRERKREELRTCIETFERQLRDAMGDQNDSPQVLLEEARRRVEMARDSAAARRHLENELPSLREEIDNLAKDLDEITKSQRQCRDRLQETLEGIGFPKQWDASLADKVLKELNGARGELQKALALDPRIDDMRKGIADYEAKVRQACDRLAPELSELPAEGASAQLADRLNNANQAQNTHAELTKTIEDAQRREKTKSTQLQSLQQKLQHFREAAGVDSDDEFYRVAADARRKADLLKEIDGLTRDIKAAAGTEDIEAFHARLCEADADSLSRELHTAQEDLAEAKKQHEQAAKNVGVAQTKLDDLDSRSEAVEASATLENRRAELQAAVDRWAPLVLAEKLMSDAIVRFEREHQPEMLQSVGQLFSQMTLGRYCGIRRRLDERDTLLVKSRDGGDKQPSQLSTGTREQLYLAIRLAYVRHYCRDSEPLPLVMDDVLVNFDDTRASETLDVLLEMAADLQIIFLTCHRQTAELIGSRLPKMKPIELTCG